MTNKSQIAGILSIISGAIGVLVAMIMFLFTSLFGFIFTDPEFGRVDGEVLPFLTAFYVTLAIFFLIFSALGIVGGIYSLRRKLWGLALAGAIAGIITFWPTGIAAIILVSLGRDEFIIPAAPASGTQQPPLTPPSPPFSPAP
jgi:hypothetical protein